MTKASAFMLYASCGIRFFLAGYAPCVHAIALDKDDGTIHKTGQPACLLEKSEGLARMFF